MSTATVLRSRYPRTSAYTDRLLGAPKRVVHAFGVITVFVVTVVAHIGHALRYHRKEILRLVAEIGMGTGAMAVIGGTVAIVGFFVALAGGSLIAIQGFASLGDIGVEAFTGFFAALANVRISAPVTASRWRPPSVRAQPRNSAQCGSVRRSMRWR